VSFEKFLRKTLETNGYQVSRDRGNWKVSYWKVSGSAFSERAGIIAIVANPKDKECAVAKPFGYKNSSPQFLHLRCCLAVAVYNYDCAAKEVA
jgi:hypothetical protein